MAGSPAIQVRSRAAHRRMNAEKLIIAGCVMTIGTDSCLGNAPGCRRVPNSPMHVIASGMRDGPATLAAGTYADLLVLD